MRKLFVLLFICANALSMGQAKLTVFRGGKVIGRITMTSKITKDGAKVDEMSMSRTENGKSVDLRILSNFAADGTPTRKFMAISLAGTTERHQIVATFKPEGVAVQVIPSLDPAQTIAPPANAQLKQLDEFWFIRDHPKVGTLLSSFVFDLGSGKWSPRKVTYLGDADLVIGGKKVHAHRVSGGIGGQSILQYLDDQGLPLRLEQGGLVFERTNP